MDWLYGVWFEKFIYSYKHLTGLSILLSTLSILLSSPILFVLLSSESLVVVSPSGKQLFEVGSTENYPLIHWHVFWRYNGIAMWTPNTSLVV